MAVCKNCRYYDDKTKSGYKGYCTTYRQYVDPDSMERGCTRYEEGTGSSSGCYLTTACVEAKKLPDNCYELTTLRNFRDTYLKAKENGSEEINYYYSTAPIIVENINKKSNANEIWCGLYKNLVEKCVTLIEAHKLDEAYRVYKKTCLELEKEYIS
ncbi:MAG: hypothetical protein J6A43_06890 [Clostridia bacterium]|nr:hypothetical protein [Clostridia bacterium]MBO5433767.1 hypothetical protein [Clostridia bacterium]